MTTHPAAAPPPPQVEHRTKSFELSNVKLVDPAEGEAGGTFTDWTGQPTIHAGAGIATNGRVLDEVLAITRGA